MYILRLFKCMLVCNCLMMIYEMNICIKAVVQGNIYTCRCSSVLNGPEDSLLWMKIEM